MRVKIEYRCDQEEYYCTDEVTIDVDNWHQVLQEIALLERRNTVYKVTRLDV